MNDLLDKIKASRTSFTTSRNRMGCDENWYHPWYAIANTFSDEELGAMSETELEHLVKLASTLSDAFY